GLAPRVQPPVHREAPRRFPEPMAREAGGEPRLSLLCPQPPSVLQLRLGLGPREDGGRVRLTLVHPCIGRRRGQPYIRTWQMEPLAPATLAGLAQRDSEVQIRFYDDRTESIPFDEPTDLVAMSV